MKRYRQMIDVSNLPTFVFGRDAITWWGTIGFAAIEGMSLIVCGVAYLYLRKNVYHWPPPPTRLPGVLLPGIGAAFLALTNIANYWLHRAVRRLDIGKTKQGFLIMSILGAIAIAFRVYDFRELNTHWDSNAYSSAAWVMVGFHAGLLVFEVIETWVFTALVWLGSLEGKHFADADDNCFYWYFMSLVWLPIYVLIYWSPRLL
jgi:heme/copper-type cytochrome/quinol oxidase subunit 3